MIAVAGEALIDLVVGDGAVVATVGGGPLNVARTVARLGEQSRFLGAISDDRFGHLIRQSLVVDGVDVSRVTTTNLPTTIAVAETDSGGAATYRFYLDGTSAGTFAPAAPTDQGLSGVSVLCVGALGLVLQPMANALAALVAGAPASVLVAVDPNCRPDAITDRIGYLILLRQVVRRADVVKVSVDDLAYVAPGVPPRDAARGVLRLGPAVVLLTDGEKPAVVVTADEELEVTVPQIEPVDTIGAGDAFTGAFLAWWSGNGFGRAELRDAESLRAATAAAALVSAKTCERIGADPPTLGQLPSSWKLPLSERSDTRVRM